MPSPATFVINGQYDAELHRLFFNYLRISPSYALVCSAPPQRLTKKTPAATRQLIETFRKHGDVYAQTFDAWRGPAPAVSCNPTLPRQGLIGPATTNEYECGGYINLLVPSHLPLARQLLECERLLRCTIDTQRTKTEPSIRYKTLWRALATVYERAKHPDIELWRVGLLANCVERFNGQLDAWAIKKSAHHAQMRRHLTLIVVRMLVLALLVAENAALGAFPVKAPLEGSQLQFPFAELQLHNRLMTSGDAEYRAICDRAAIVRLK